MQHIPQIKELIENERYVEAHEALDNLLALGPKNTEALKLRAALYAYEGRFADEAPLWTRVLEIDEEDPDAINYVLKRQMEEREHYYFTDEIAGRGRRYLAYPRGLIRMASLGLGGCMVFLVLTRLSLLVPSLTSPGALLSLFTLLVIGPWVGIIVSYCCAVRAISVDERGLEIAKRFGRRSLLWRDVEAVYLAHAGGEKAPQLDLVVVPRDAGADVVCIDLSEAGSAIRARTHFIKEVERLYANPARVRKDSLALGQRRLARF